MFWSVWSLFSDRWSSLHRPIMPLEEIARLPSIDQFALLIFPSAGGLTYLSLDIRDLDFALTRNHYFLDTHAEISLWQPKWLQIVFYLHSDCNGWGYFPSFDLSIFYSNSSLFHTFTSFGSKSGFSSGLPKNRHLVWALWFLWQREVLSESWFDFAFFPKIPSLQPSSEWKAQLIPNRPIAEGLEKKP